MITNFKIYETYEDSLNFMSYKRGDFIVLTKFNEYSKERGFIIGDVYKIELLDHDSEEFRIHNDDNDIDVWITALEIRKAEPYEIDAIKFNL